MRDRFTHFVYVFTVYVFALTTIVGLLRTNTFYNWGEQYSRCAKWLGKVCEEQPSFVMLMGAYVIETFQCFLITGIVMIGVWCAPIKNGQDIYLQ